MLFALNWPIQGDFTPVIDIVVSLLLIAGIIYFCLRYKLSWKVIVYACICITLFVLCGIFNLPIARGVTIVFICLLAVYVSLIISTPEKEQEIRHNKKVSKKESSLTINETDELISNLQKAIVSLSQTQTGALITIERDDDLASFAQKGTKVNATVTPELICTIFYKGTSLHDGAVIVRGNMISAAAVFYQPTQKALNGKFGSRHRAALGISEITDSLTIIVSEETGKVSLAYKGELIAVPVAQFSEKFKEYYFVENKK